MSSVGGVNNTQNQSFLDLLNKQQMSYTNNPPQMPMNGQNLADVYEGPRREQKKSSFGKKVLTLLLIAGAALGVNRFAHAKALMKPVEENSANLVDKYIKTPLKTVDDWVVKTYNKFFSKASKDGNASE